MFTTPWHNGMVGAQCAKDTLLKQVLHSTKQMEERREVFQFPALSQNAQGKKQRPACLSVPVPAWNVCSDLIERVGGEAEDSVEFSCPVPSSRQQAKVSVLSHLPIPMI